MSRIKRFYEDLSEQVSTAIYEECFDMADHLEMDRFQLYDETFRMLTSGDYEPIMFYLAMFLSDRQQDEMPLTVKAYQMLTAIYRRMSK